MLIRMPVEVIAPPEEVCTYLVDLDRALQFLTARKVFEYISRATALIRRVANPCEGSHPFCCFHLCQTVLTS